MLYTEYTDKLEYMTFVESMIEEQQEMEEYINRCVILSNPNKKVFNEFTVLNEAKAGDRIKGFFNRLKSFFSRIWQKFLEKLNAWSQDNKKYLETYKDIIIGKKITLDSAKMKDHFKGKVRMNTVINNVSNFATVIDFDQFNTDDGKNISNNTISTTAKASVDAGNDEAKAGKYNEFVMNQYKEVFTHAGIENVPMTDNEDINSASSNLTEYFNGGEDVETYNTSDLQNKIVTMFNEVYSYKETLDGLTKIQESYKSGMDKTEKAYDTTFTKISNMLKDKANSQNADEKDKIDTKVKDVDDDIQSRLDKAKEENKKETQESKTESSELYNNFDSYLNEAEVTVKSADTSSQKSDTSGTSKAGGTTTDTTTSKNISKSTETNLSNKNKEVTATVKDGSNNIAAEKAASKDAQSIDTKKLDEFQSTAMDLIKAYSTVRTTIFATMLNALTSMRNDYMVIIRAHVNSYLGKVQDSGDNTGKTTSNPNTTK